MVFLKSAVWKKVIGKRMRFRVQWLAWLQLVGASVKDEIFCVHVAVWDKVETGENSKFI